MTNNYRHGVGGIGDGDGPVKRIARKNKRQGMGERQGAEGAGRSERVRGEVKTAGGVGMGTLKGWNREGGEERCRDGDTAEGMEQEGIGRELEV